MFIRIGIFLMFAVAVFGATQRLYLKDGTYQLVREYQVQSDRVHFYSTERGEWEDVPLDMIDLARTKKEAADHEADFAADVKAQSEEDAAERAVAKEIERIPVAPGVYHVNGESMDTVKIAESSVVGNKKRTVLKVLSPIPLVPGKQTVELAGESSAMRIVGEKRPEFYFRLSNEERLAMVKLTPKKGARVVEDVEIIPVSKEVIEKPDEVATFKKQVGDLLFKIWPVVDMEPGEYALIEYTEGKMNLQTWDFGIGPASASSNPPKKGK
jgi:hypothetical protein